jgi:hypothetical protein
MPARASAPVGGAVVAAGSCAASLVAVLVIRTPVEMAWILALGLLGLLSGVQLVSLLSLQVVCLSLFDPLQ